MIRYRAYGQPPSRAAYWRQIRLALWIPAYRIAEVSGFSVAYVYAIEREERPLLPHVEDVLRVVYEREMARVYSDAGRLEAA